MANILRHGEFLLPPEFLTDDDLHTDKENFTGNGLCFPSEFPYEFGESESDEEDISGLTHLFSRSSLRNPQKISFPPNLEAKWGFSGSPQSTLSPAGSWSVSSNGSPNGPSQVPSPPTTPFVQIDDTWDLIYAAAGQVARMKMNRNHIEEPTENRAFFPHTRSFAPPNYSNNCSSHSLCHHNQFQQVRPVPVIKQQGCSTWGKQERERWFPPPPETHQTKGLRVGVENGRPMGLPPSAWPPLEVQNQRNQNQLVQQNNGSAMRAVFLSGSVSGGGVKRECAGTGVFIPRNPSECRKRPACSTAVLPARAIQGLNKNFEPLISRAQAHVQSRAHFDGGFITNHEVLIARRNAAMAQQQQQRQNIRPEVMMKHHEVLLPQEWTY